MWRVKAMLILYTFLLLIGFVLSLASDLSRLVPALLKLSLTLQILATVFFVLVGKADLQKCRFMRALMCYSSFACCWTVPLTHFSGSLYHQKWRFWQPFRGGVR